MVWGVLVAGIGCLAIAVVFIVRILGAPKSLFAQVDWGLDGGHFLGGAVRDLGHRGDPNR